MNILVMRFILHLESGIWYLASKIKLTTSITYNGK